MSKFGKYLPTLASLSSLVRLVHREDRGEMEVHGPPEAKAQILSYFSSLFDMIETDKVKNIVIVEEEQKN